MQLHRYISYLVVLLLISFLCDANSVKEDNRVLTTESFQSSNRFLQDDVNQYRNAVVVGCDVHTLIGILESLVADNDSSNINLSVKIDAEADLDIKSSIEDFKRLFHCVTLFPIDDYCS